MQPDILTMIPKISEDLDNSGFDIQIGGVDYFASMRESDWVISDSEEREMFALPPELGVEVVAMFLYFYEMGSRKSMEDASDMFAMPTSGLLPLLGVPDHENLIWDTLKEASTLKEIRAVEHEAMFA